MKIKKETPCIFLRIPNYSNYNFMEEHILAFNKYKKVWLMKIGKKPNVSYVNDVIKENGVLILKTPKRFGEKFYFCKIDSCKYDNSKQFPEYYNDILNNNYMNKEKLIDESFWVRIVQIFEVPEDMLENFYTLKKHSNFLESVYKLRQVSYMYIYPEKDICIK